MYFALKYLATKPVREGVLTFRERRFAGCDYVEGSGANFGALGLPVALDTLDVLRSSPFFTCILYFIRTISGASYCLKEDCIGEESHGSGWIGSLHLSRLSLRCGEGESLCPSRDEMKKGGTQDNEKDVTAREKRLCIPTYWGTFPQHIVNQTMLSR